MAIMGCYCRELHKLERFFLEELGDGKSLREMVAEHKAVKVDSPELEIPTPYEKYINYTAILYAPGILQPLEGTMIFMHPQLGDGPGESRQSVTDSSDTSIHNYT